MYHWERLLAHLCDYLFMIYIAVCMDDYETFQYVAKLLSRHGFSPSKWNLISKSSSGL